MKPNWASISGNVDLSNNEIALLPSSLSQAAPIPADVIPRAVVRSNLQFGQGTISLEVKLPEPDAQCLIGLNVEQGGELYAGLNNFGALYGLAIWRDGQWKRLAGSGYGGTLESDRWYNLTLSVRGSTPASSSPTSPRTTPMSSARLATPMALEKPPYCSAIKNASAFPLMFPVFAHFSMTTQSPEKVKSRLV